MMQAINVTDDQVLVYTVGWAGTLSVNFLLKLGTSACENQW